MTLSVTPTIKSPCKLICTLDLESAICKGCGRTREEIGRWTRFSDEQRDVVMERVKDWEERD